MPPKLHIEYSLEFEEDRVQATLRDSAWLHEHGYQPSLPGNISLNDAMGGF